MEYIQTIVTRGQLAMGKFTLGQWNNYIQIIVTQGQLVNGKPTFGPGNRTRELQGQGQIEEIE